MCHLRPGKRKPSAAKAKEPRTDHVSVMLSPSKDNGSVDVTLKVKAARPRATTESAAKGNGEKAAAAAGEAATAEVAAAAPAKEPASADAAATPAKEPASAEAAPAPAKEPARSERPPADDLPKAVAEAAAPEAAALTATELEQSTLAASKEG
jgi:hypothetical protein